MVHLLQPKESKMSHNSRLSAEAVKILTPFGVGEQSIGRLLQSYSEVWRSYHNSSHIMQMLMLSRRFDIKLTNHERQLLELMILYHDAWYKIGRPAGENERRSADWACQDLHNEDIVFLQALREGIEATITHTLANIAKSNTVVVSTLLDLDLWGLGQKPEYFKRTSERIWREFQPIATREEFNKGRSAWARKFLDSRNTIYHTPLFSQFEDQAKQNLTALAG